MAGLRSLNVFIEIGAKGASSVGASASAVEQRFAAMGRKISVQAAEMKAVSKSMNGAYKDMALLLAGGGATSLLKKSILAGSDYEHQVDILRRNGNAASDVAAAIAAANKTLKDAPTSTLTDNLKIINETTLAYGSLGHAMENLSFNAKLGALMKNIMGNDYNVSEGFNNLVRALEFRGGKLSSEDYQRLAGKFYQAMSVSGGKVNAEQILGFAQTSALPIKRMSEEYLTRIVPSLIQEFGGDRAGTVSTALSNALSGRVAQGGRSITEEWIRLGLVPKKGTGGNLSATGWSPESLKQHALAQQDPFTWFKTVMFPALSSHGVNTNDPEQMLLAAQKLFGRETAKRLASTLMDPRQLDRLIADKAQYEKAMGVNDAYANALRNDPKMAMAMAAASLDRLETNLGKAITPEVISGLTNFAKGINFLAGVIDKHPGFGKAIAGAMASIAGLATMRFLGLALDFLKLGNIFKWFGGTALRGLMTALLTFGDLLLAIGTTIGATLGIIAVAIAAVGAAIAWLIVKWDGIKAFFVGFAEGVWKAMDPKTQEALRNFAKFLGEIGDAISAGLGKALDWVSEKLKTFFGYIFGPPDTKNWKAFGEEVGGWVGRRINDFTRFLELLGQIKDALANVPKGLGENATAMFGGPGVSVSRPMTGAALGGAAAAAAKPAGARALGGPVNRGSWYRINERGQELFAPGANGSVINARATAALLAAANNNAPRAANNNAPLVGEIHIHGQTDPQATAREVERVLHRMAYQQRGGLHD